MAGGRGSNIILVGFMGTGKSSVGRLLAARLRRRYFDTDSWIVRETGMSIPTLFADFGEQAFRDMETRAAQEVSGRTGLVVSTGGGILGRPRNLELLRASGVLICLQAGVDTILQRTAPWDSRPLLRDAPNPRATVEQLLARRAEQYARADWAIDTSGLEPADVVERICEKLPSLLRDAATPS
ncbi:MAG TPA: shikimate kinase [Armatimonadota bacterium]|nr:shikimate kinase [Armatimonadota bacterium]